MYKHVRRIFVEKKNGFDVEAQGLYRDLRDNLLMKGIRGLRIVNRYDVEGIYDEEYGIARNIIFSEPMVDWAHDEEIEIDPGSRVFAIEYLPGQYDQRADSASQCIQILTGGEKPVVRAAKLIVIHGELSDEEYARVKDYCINPVESREAQLGKPETLEHESPMPDDVETLAGFISMDDRAVEGLMKKMGFAMSEEDLKFCRNYFRDTEKRNPTVTEIRLIDTYWSDHCRHTTFLTEINGIEIEDGPYAGAIGDALKMYRESREVVYGERDKDVCLMDLATIAMKHLRKKGLLKDLDESDEINACSIVVEVDRDGGMEEWLVMFKNETHNHPTEIEPFGGAATCLGGAIRDPLSGRVYVYQAMRVTGSGDPRAKVKDTLPGKLPQRKITTGAAAGYSSYGNQIGLATGQVAEIYDPGYVAKRMEIGAVIGAAPRKNVVREKPVAGDVIILLGGRTGRDGCGGATGSSKEHTEESVLTSGAEVQKGNPPTERKIQRLFRKPEVSALIKKCNDFGAGGVSVAIGELADGLVIDLDAVPKKYEGLDGTELAISESQERMAVVVDPGDVEAFLAAAREENLEAVRVALVTEEERLRMIWRGRTIVDISREFLNTNGVKQHARVKVVSPDANSSFFKSLAPEVAEKLGSLSEREGQYRRDARDGGNGQYGEDGGKNLAETWISNLQRLNVCSQKGLVERFDSTIGAGTVIMPFGGKTQLTPAEGMAAKIPVLEGDTSTGTLMTYGFNPSISSWSPFHGSVYALVESLAKLTAMGGDYKKARLTLQEYFEKLGKDPIKWGKPFSALLGAYYAQIRLGIPAIGGKDSMSGTFMELSVPPTLVSFAVTAGNVNHFISTEFKNAGSEVVLVPLRRDGQELPDFDQLDKNYKAIHNAIKQGQVISASALKAGGIAEAVTKMCFGNNIGFAFDGHMSPESLFAADYGSLVLEMATGADPEKVLGGIKHLLLGSTRERGTIKVNGQELSLDTLLEAWQQPLEKIFPTRYDSTADEDTLQKFSYSRMKGEVSDSRSDRDTDAQKKDRKGAVNVYSDNGKKHLPLRIARPRVFIPVFPGTNCEYDTARAFEKAGAIAQVFVLNNLSSAEIEEAMEAMAHSIDRAQMVVIPGGFSGGDEPEGSGKFIATAFRNPYVKESVMNLLKNRDGLMLGICNGFQALIKLGLVPYGEIRDMTDSCPTLTFNTIGRHISCMSHTRVASTLSPWLANVREGDIHSIAMSHGEGRFVASPEVIRTLAANGQIATQYVDLSGNPTYDIAFNPNGSIEAIEGITSPDGRVLGKMGHSERIGTNVVKNVPGAKDQKLFEAGVAYFR